MDMKKKRKRIGRNRPFNRIALFPFKPVPEIVRVRQVVEKAFPCKFCRMSYLDSMIDEFDRLIEIDEKRVAIVDDNGNNMSQLYNLMAMMQGNGE